MTRQEAVEEGLADYQKGRVWDYELKDKKDMSPYDITLSEIKGPDTGYKFPFPSAGEFGVNGAYAYILPQVDGNKVTFVVNPDGVSVTSKDPKSFYTDIFIQAVTEANQFAEDLAEKAVSVGWGAEVIKADVDEEIEKMASYSEPNN